jgi:hypothetical protein
LGTALLHCIDDAATRQELIGAFDAIHHELRRDADHNAATAVLEVAGR